MIIIEEIWKDIEGYEGYYQVSNLGRVKSLERSYIGPHNSIHFVKERILKPEIQWNGRLQVRLSKGCQLRAFKVHRLVAIAFIPNPDNKPYINHLDCDPTNNIVDNLEWCTPKENSQYASKLGRQKGKENAMKYCAKAVIATNLQTGEEIYFESQKEAMHKLNTTKVNQVCRGKQKSSKGYTFRYANNNK